VIVILESQRGTGEDFGLAAIQGDSAHGLARHLRLLETVQYLVSALDHLGGHVAFMRHARVRYGVAAD